jgi:hypothetical protein
MDNACFSGISFSPIRYFFKVAAVTDGPQTLLRPDSIQLLEQIHLIAKQAAIENFIARCEKEQTQSEELLDRSPQPRHSQRVSLLEGDVVVDVDRTIETSSPSMGASIGEEIKRVSQISEYFILWCFND